MLKRILPQRLDNAYPGPRLGLWLMLPILIQKFGTSLTHLFRSDGGASISTIPLDAYPAGAAQNIVGLFARMGLEQMLLALLLLLALLRYRSMVPLMYLLVVVHYLGSRAIGDFKPLVRTGASGAAMPALVVAVVAAVGLVLSLAGSPRRA